MKIAIPLVLLLSANASAQIVCQKIHSAHVSLAGRQTIADKELSENIFDFMGLLGNGSTTSLRQEDKYVVSNGRIDQLISELEINHGQDFQLRDEKIDGYKNVTVTQYANPITVTTDSGKKVSAKIRFRRYFQAEENIPLSQGKMRPAPISENKEFVEFKIDHPTLRQVVIKPRILMNSEDAQMLRDRDLFLKNKMSLIRRAIAMNPKVNRAVILQFFRALGDFYSDVAINLPLFAKTSYVRDSYSLMLKSNLGEKVEIQLTVDREVQVTDSLNGQKIQAYRPSDAVVELKVPVAYAKLTDADVQKVPGLAAVAQLKKELEGSHLKDHYRIGTGKLSTSRRLMTDDLIDD